MGEITRLLQEREVRLDTRKLPVGVEISGLDLARPIGEEAGEALRKCLARHQLLVFRNQRLGPEDQIRVLETFGSVLDEKQDGKRYQYVSGKETSVRPGRLLFHSDNHFVQVPLELLSLYGEEVGPAATPTIFVDNVVGHARLPAALAERLEHLEIINRSFFHLGYSDQVARDLPEELSGGPVARHPAVWHHPDTGLPFVYLSELHAFRFAGLPAEESNRLLDQVFEVLYDPAHTYEHQWADGDLIIWNNRTVQHARGELSDSAADGGSARSIRRVSVGPIGFSEQFQFAPEVSAQIAQSSGSFYGQQVSEQRR
jgi:taurine dioxygenase